MQSNLTKLKDYLADPSQWPSDFKWEYVYPYQCAHGLACKLFPEINWVVYDHPASAKFFGITPEQSKYIFETKTELPIKDEDLDPWEAVTPAEVIARIEKVLKTNN
jgi:hypothetical protein